MNTTTTAALAGEFTGIVGADNVMISENDRYAYSYDAAVLDSVMPGIVVRPGSSETLGQVVKLCNDNGLPLTVRGAGTNLSGGTIPHPGGVVVLTNGLTRILEINEEDLYAVVEPGVITAVFAQEVARRGLFYPPDPGSHDRLHPGRQRRRECRRPARPEVRGDQGLRHGPGVLGCRRQAGQIRLPHRQIGDRLQPPWSDGRLGGHARGLHKIILKLIPPPQTARSMLAVFDSIAAASETVAAIIAAKIVPATLEFLDNFTIRTVEDYRKVGLPTDAAALLLIEVDGHPGQVADEAAQVEAICKKHAARELKVAGNASERNTIWQARRDALSALARLKPTSVLEDATVPRSKIPAMIEALGEISRKYDLTIGTFGHAGDGNLHPTILTDERDTEEMASGGKGRRGDLRPGPGLGRHPLRRARHRPGQGQISHQGDRPGHP